MSLRKYPRLLFIPCLLAFSCATDRPREERVFTEWGPVDPRPSTDSATRQPNRRRVPRSDFQIRGEFLAAMAADPSIDVFDYRVAVADGEIYLKGQTPSQGEARRAERLARRMDGVKDVHNEVVVRNELKELRELEQMDEALVVSPRPLSDLEIRRTIIDRFMADNRVMIQDQAIRVKAGEVTLSGKVLNLKTRQAALEIARSVPGVRAVRDRMTLGLADAPSDAQLRQNILSVLKLDPYFDPDNVKIGVRNGIVSLSGTVASTQEARQIADLIAEVRGVTAIKNQLKS